MIELNYLNDEITLSMRAFANADVNGDGSINDDDYDLLNAYINLYSNNEIIYPLYKPELKYYQITYELFDGKATNIDKYSIGSGNITLKNICILLIPKTYPASYCPLEIDSIPPRYISEK